MVLFVSGTPDLDRPGNGREAALSFARAGLQRSNQEGSEGGWDREAGHEPCPAALIRPVRLRVSPFGLRFAASKTPPALGVFQELLGHEDSCGGGAPAPCPLRAADRLAGSARPLRSSTPRRRFTCTSRWGSVVSGWRVRWMAWKRRRDGTGHDGLTHALRH